MKMQTSLKRLPKWSPLTLADLLRRYLPLAVNLNTEKARSEFVIAPFLAEFKLLYRDKISLFSGLEFTINEAAGLKGRCDYILAQARATRADGPGVRRGRGQE